MAWTTPKTFAAGERLFASDLNTYVSDNLADLDTRVDGKIDLPAGPSDGEVLTYDSGTSAWVAEALPAVAAGKILQVVSASTSSTFSTASTTYTNFTGLQVSITPSSATSKVFVIVQFGSQNNNSGNNTKYATIARGTTAIGVESQHAVGTNATTKIMGPTLSFLDSPNTTSSTTYRGRVRVSNDTSNWDGGTIVAMEVGA